MRWLGGVKNDYGCIAHRYVLYGLDNHGHFTVASLSSINHCLKKFKTCSFPFLCMMLGSTAEFVMMWSFADFQ